MWKLLISLMFIKSNSAFKICDTIQTLTNGDGNTYRRSENFEENGNITACECKAYSHISICILKCCARGKGYDWKQKTCVPTAEPFRFESNEYLKVPSKIVSDKFQVDYRKPRCNKNETRALLRLLLHQKNEIRSVSLFYICYKET